ncbi:MAG TPA: chromate transporter [Chloroflexi bacterium]|jgi:chromate transporter|nr:chromate transporter [Chloroflexota bacterium]
MIQSDSRSGSEPDGRHLSAIQVALLLGFIGLVAFGGPAAHVALMRRELVERRRWLEPERFSRMFAACNLIPGPSSTELALFIGYRLAGWRGLLAAGACFIAPAMVIMLGLAWTYTHYANTGWVQALLYGVRPVVVGIIAWAAMDLGRKMLQPRVLILVSVVSLGLFLIGLNPVVVLALMALVAIAITQLRRGAGAAATTIAADLLGPHPERLMTLALTFLKLGAVSFGSGYVLFAFLHSDFVDGLHWLKPGQLIDVVAIGQVTPGPVFTTATFLGYLFAGVPGALLATLAIFLPGLVLVPFLDRLVALVETHPLVRHGLNGVNAAVIGLIVGVGLQLARASIDSWLTAAITLLAFLIVLWKPLAAPVAVVGGAVAGIVMRTVH